MSQIDFCDGDSSWIKTLELLLYVKSMTVWADYQSKYCENTDNLVVIENFRHYGSMSILKENTQVQIQSYSYLSLSSIAPFNPLKRPQV